MDELFFKPHQPLTIYGTHLPHWQQERVWQFVTFRLKDSIPAALAKDYLSERDRWLMAHPLPWSEADRQRYHELFTQRIHKWLDKGHGTCHLRISANREILAEVIMRDHPVRVVMASWIIMPNHVHLLFSSPIELSKLIGCWKSVSAKIIRLGSIWQSNYFDTLIRNRRHFYAVVNYIRNNGQALNPATFSYWENELLLKQFSNG